MLKAIFRNPRWGWVAACWSVILAAVHFFWALGGSLGLAESAGARLASERPLSFVAFGLWGVGALLLAAGVIGALLAGQSMTGGRRRALLLLGAGIAAILLLRAVVIELLLLTRGLQGAQAVSDSQRYWTLVLWNPWFLLGG